MERESASSSMAAPLECNLLKQIYNLTWTAGGPASRKSSRHEKKPTKWRSFPGLSKGRLSEHQSLCGSRTRTLGRRPIQKWPPSSDLRMRISLTRPSSEFGAGLAEDAQARGS